MNLLIVFTSVLCLKYVAPLQPAQVELYGEHGIKITIPDEGYDFVAVHFSINKNIQGVAAGQWNADVRNKVGSSFVYTNDQPQLMVRKGDTIHYWLHAQKAGIPEERFGLSSVIGEKITTTTTTTTTTTKQPTTKTPTTKAPSAGSGGHAAAQPAVGGIITQTMIETKGGNTGSGTGGALNLGSLPAAGGGGSAATTGNCACTQTKRSCTSYPCLVFEDNFDFLDFDTWEHEITASGGGNWEFQYYTNNRTNSYTKDGKLYIKPTLTADNFGEKFLTTGTLDLWGSEPNSQCTSNIFWGCKRGGTAEHPINPIQSARLRSNRGFSFKYGKMEVRAKMPKGDWLWPAIWMLPLRNVYGGWPASGEIDIVESRGNVDYHDEKGRSQGVDSFGSTLHFGPIMQYDPWDHAHAEKTVSSGNLHDDFHTWVLEWNEDHIKVSFEGEEILNVAPPPEGFWKLGELEKSNINNPYKYTNNKMAPFDQEFFIILNVAVGGVGFFGDNMRNSPYPKPWNDHSDFTTRDFWNQKNQWYPTWNPDKDDGEQAAMQVDYIRVWKMKP